MIEMTMWFYWFSLAVVSAGAGFFAYWMGVSKTEVKKAGRWFDENEASSDRIRVLSAENRALRKQVDALEFELRTFYPENSWNNVPNVPEQPQ